MNISKRISINIILSSAMIFFSYENKRYESQKWDCKEEEKKILRTFGLIDTGEFH